MTKYLSERIGRLQAQLAVMCTISLAISKQRNDYRAGRVSAEQALRNIADATRSREDKAQKEINSCNRAIEKIIINKAESRRKAIYIFLLLATGLTGVIATFLVWGFVIGSVSMLSMIAWLVAAMLYSMLLISYRKHVHRLKRFERRIQKRNDYA